jgi:hypothetical protein
MEHPKSKDDRSTLAIMLALHDAGYELLVPFGENTRYDFVIDDVLRLARVQCKTGRLRKGGVIFSACSSYAHHPNPKMVTRSYLGQIDYFAVFCLDTGVSYLIPIEDAPVTRRGKLRIDPPRINQRVGVRFAADYEIRPRSAN